MKKIFLFFMILGLSLMSFVDTQAYTHTSYDGYDLDSINQDLGVSLRDFFETYNLLTDLNILNCFQCSKVLIGDTLTITPSGYNTYPAAYISSVNLNIPQSHYLYVRTDFYTEGNGLLNNATFNLVIGSTSVSQAPNNLFRWYFLSNIAQTTGIAVEFQFRPSTNTNDIYKIKNVYAINLSMLNIQPDVDLLDHYYFVYRILKERELAYDNGYDTGNLDGYATGFNDGTTYGQNEYHTGNYGTLDETQGIPYNDGYNAGVAEELDTNYLLSFVQGSIAVLNAPILPNITLGVFVFIPLFFGFVAFLFRLGGKRG